MTKTENKLRTFRVPDLIWDKIKKAASLDGKRSVSSWIRSRLESAANYEISQK